MRIDQLFEKGRPTVSFEFFPPKTDEGFTQLFTTIKNLKPLHPSYVSVTYGAGGSTRQKTVDLVTRIQRELDILAMAHLTCVGHTAEDIGEITDRLKSNGIHNILALRGDPPQGQRTFTSTEGGFQHANELVKFIRGRDAFCLGVAGYPEGHPECPDMLQVLEHLKLKVDAGANFVVSQLFFDNADFYRWRDAARAKGITVPMIAGIMPILNVTQTKKFTSMCGAKIPPALLRTLEAVESNPDAVYAAGVAHAINQCRDLLKHGVDGLHFYTLNKSHATVEICQALHLAPA